MIKKVFLIFKTHLDVGFTDYAKNVVDKYIEKYIPNAIKIGNELKDTKTPFVWTMGSWMVKEALKRDKDGTLSEAIKDGIIAWHALPFTTHTELMNEELFECGLDIAKELDEMFDVKSVGGKMTDVPGHTKGLVPLLAKRGIKLLHIGVNPASPQPDVPNMFRWKCGDDSIVVVYNGEDYGGGFEVGDTAVVFGFTGDNAGPQTSEDVIRVYDEVQKKFPDAEICSGTLNDAADVADRAENLPVVDAEIGDTWIHGVGTDPMKLAAYRSILRNVKNLKDYDLSDSLLMVPEHTWGMDLKRFFKDVEHFSPDELDECVGREDRVAFEKSWQEQRDYVNKAMEITGFDCFEDIKVTAPDLSGFKKIDKQNVGIEISYQLFDNNDYARYKQEYMQIDIEWAIWDNIKVGLYDYKGGIYDAKCVEMYENDNGVYMYKLVFDKEISSKYGLPIFWIEENGDMVTVKWFGKRANRMPEAYWLKFKGFNEKWQMHKMGHWIEPSECLGNRGLHAIDKGIKNNEVLIESYDAALVAPFGRQMLTVAKVRDEDMYFNLYNNIWNTNFPMWYSDDAKFRFKITKETVI